MPRLEVDLSAREREALDEWLEEVRAIWRVLSPIVAPLAADLRRQENWRIVQSVAERAMAPAKQPAAPGALDMAYAAHLAAGLVPALEALASSWEDQADRAAPVITYGSPGAGSSGGGSASVSAGATGSAPVGGFGGGGGSGASALDARSLRVHARQLREAIAQGGQG